MQRLALIALLVSATTPGALGSVSIVTSGTPGSTPVSLAVQQDVSMNVTTATTPGNFILFAFRNTSPSPFGSGIHSLSGNLTFSINGSGAYSMNGWHDGGFASGAITANDSYFFWTSTVALSVGDTVTLRAGTISSQATAPADFFLPASGSYELFLINASGGTGGTLISGPAAPIPEPSTYGLILGGLALAGAALRRRKARQA